jgi:PKD repeat protein
VACIPSTASVAQVELSSSVTVQALEADRPLNLSGTLSVSSSTITSSISSGTTLTGTLTGAGATTINGSLTWGPNGGFSGSGTTTIEPGTTVTVAGDDVYCGGCEVNRAVNENGTLVNEGTIVFPDESQTRSMNLCGGNFDNKGTLELNDNVVFEADCTPTSIDNTGTITKASGTGTATIDVDLDNEGTVSAGASDAGHGTLDLPSLSTCDPSSSTLSGGTFAAIHGGSLQLDNVGTVTATNAVVDVDGAGSSVVGSGSTPVLSSLSAVGLHGGVTLRNGQSLTTPGPLQNAGVVRLGPSSSLTTTGSYTQTQGITELDDPTASLTATAGQVVMDAGTFSGPGTVSPALNVVGGTLHPGADPGTLAVSGPATVAAGSSVTGAVDGTSPSQYDRLTTTGALVVGGSLTLSRGPGYSPTNGDAFTLASGSSRTGTFANITQDLTFAGWYFTPTYTSTSAGVTIHRVTGPDVIATASAKGSAFDVPIPGSWTVNVENAGSSATTGPVSVQTPLGSGQSLQSSSGSGWSCNGTTTVTCTTSVTAAAGTSFAPITLTVGLTTAAQPSTTLALSVSGGGDAYTGDNTFSTSIPVQNVPAPHASLGISSIRGSVPFTVEFDGTGSTGATNYSWDFGDGNNSTAAQPAHTYLSPGVYTVTLRVDNALMSDTASTQVTMLADVPLSADAGDDQTVTTGEIASFDGSSSQPVGGIDSYAWSFGGGSTARGATATHSWSTPGDYPVTLTVTSGSQVASDTITVHVVPAPGSGLAVTVTDGTSPISGASAVVLDAQGNRYAATSASNGIATVTGLADATYSLYVFAPGYEPQVAQATVTNGAGVAAVTLSAGSVGTTSVTSQPMTYDQIVAAGIDPNDPDNQNVLNFSICLAFDGSSCVAFTGDVNQEGDIFSGAIGGGGGGTGTCSETSCVYDIPADQGGGEAIATVAQMGGEPTAMILRIPGQAKWLKEFFDVQMAVVNLAPAGFTFTDGAATLDIPPGLSLAPTPTPQTATIEVPDVPGGQSQEVSWIARGDAEGFYDLHAHYGATLNPIGASIDLDAQTATPLHVWGLSAVGLQVTADDAAVAHEPYRIHVEMTNVTSGADATPIYNPTLELDQNAGAGDFIFEPDEQFSQGTAELDPGQSFGADYVIIPVNNGTLNPAGSVTFLDSGAAEGPTDPVTSQARVAAIPLSAKASGKKLKFTWGAASGATGYRLYVTPSDTTPFGDGSLVAQFSASKTSAKIPLPLGTHWYTISTEDSSQVWTTYHQLTKYINPNGQPTLTTLSKTSGPAAGGTLVTVTGKNLNGATQVDFGTTAGTKVKVNGQGTSVSVVTPAHAVGTVDVTVVTPNGTTPVTKADSYKYK